ncbi:protoporphyrinogen oxidase [Spirosoma validum]|uniref:Coproporphyrinogen III oxidase n=1 Tax=Spirosoma validum TaxID=2771355 RepID=A0A927AXN7_9BACT|nr:protoporphyrinogen oxidase [Spirosoma validum]MBD2751744.1 protoporphyrinogen oxidase [Spirosoma validum]
MTVGIIGAGISGLTVAYELQKRGVDYQLWEAADRPGGYIQSRRDQSNNQPADATGQYLRELGPNSLLGDADLLFWLDELGLTPDILFSKPVSKARYIFRNGRYQKLPSGPISLLFGGFFSWKTKLAILRERNNKTLSPQAESTQGETLAQFFRRRFSDEIVEYALGPFVAGIYAGDPEQLLVSETFPVLLQYEKEYGSVLRGLIKNQSATGRRHSFSFREGMQMLPDALAAKLTGLSLNDPVQRIQKSTDGWRVESRSGIKTVDQLVITTPTNVAAKLTGSIYPELASKLSQIAYPPMTAVHSVYKRTDVQHPLDGFGGLNPKIEGRFSSGHIWSSSVFDGRCPEDEVLFTTFVGGEANPDNARLPDEDVFSRVHQELVEGFGVKASKPVFRAIQRWEYAIPQYNAHITAVKRPVQTVEVDSLYVCANWYGGVSLSDCIRKAQKLAEKLTEKSAVNNF